MNKSRSTSPAVFKPTMERSTVYVKLAGTNNIIPRIRVEQAIILGHAGPKEFEISFVGEMGFASAIDDLMSAVLHIMKHVDEKGKGKEKTMIYDHVIQAFSGVCHAFAPEMDGKQFGTLSDAQIIEAENKALENAVHK